MTPQAYVRGRTYSSRNPKAQGTRLRYVLARPPSWLRTNNSKRWAECDHWKVFVQVGGLELCVAAWNAVKVTETTLRERFHVLLGKAKI